MRGVFVWLVAGCVAAAQGARVFRVPPVFVEDPFGGGYVVVGTAKTLRFTSGGYTIRFSGGGCVAVRFVGGRRVRPVGRRPGAGRVQVFTGGRVARRLRTFREIRYPEVWPGIAAVFRVEEEGVKYAFEVAPGADPGRICLAYRGARVGVTAAGVLAVEYGGGRLLAPAPAAWQEGAGGRVEVAARWAVRGEREVGFEVGRYDPERPLHLDPVLLAYCGYLGLLVSEAYGIAVDGQGQAYVCGATSYWLGVGHSHGLFVAKLNALGTGFRYLTVIPGSPRDVAYGIAVDGQGNAYVVGSVGWPVWGNLLAPTARGRLGRYGGGRTDAFVLKLGPRGRRVVYAALLGGAQDEEARAVAVDAQGHAYVAGRTASNEATFPVRVGPDLTFNGFGRHPAMVYGGGDAFVAKLAPDGSRLVYCGYVGGAGDEEARGLALTATGEVVVAGATSSPQGGFPVRVGPDLTFNERLWLMKPAVWRFKPIPLWGTDGFVAKVAADGRSLVYCGYIGGALPDAAVAVAVDAQGAAYVAGTTASDETSFPVRVGPDLTYNGRGDCFVAKVEPTGRRLAWCGYVGGTAWDGDARVLGARFSNGFFPQLGVAVDGTGAVYLAGETFSDERSFPVRLGPDVTFNALPWPQSLRPDGFVAKITPGGKGLEYCGYIGGLDGDWISAVAVDGKGAAYVAGMTLSFAGTVRPFPVSTGPRRVKTRALLEAFVAKVPPKMVLIESGAHRLRTTVTLSLRLPAEAGRPYRMAASFGTGPVLLGGQVLHLSPGPLFRLSYGGSAAPGLFQNFQGVLDARGRATARLVIPPVPLLIGLRIYAAAATLDPRRPAGVRTVTNSVWFLVAP